MRLRPTCTHPNLSRRLTRDTAHLGARPGKDQPVQACSLEPRPDMHTQLIRHPLDIVANQADQVAALLLGQCAIGNAV